MNRKLISSLNLLIAIISLIAQSSSALAMSKGGSTQPVHPGPGGGLLRCSYDDTGWEEHGGHATCGECLSRHGSCEENCYSVYYACKAEGVDRSGKPFTAEAYSDYSEMDARNMALDRCYYSGGTNCFVKSCSQEEKRISNRRCG